MSDDSHHKLAEAHAEEYRDESDLFDGDEPLAEVMATALEQARGVRDEDGERVTKHEQAAQAKQVELSRRITGE